MNTTRRAAAVSMLLSASLLLSGCATIFTGSTQPVSVQSNPPGATVTINGMQMGTTPCQVVVKRGGSQAMQLSKAGYKTQTVMLGSKFNGWFLGNILLGGILGIIVDIVTGAIVWVDPEAVMVHLSTK